MNEENLKKYEDMVAFNRSNRFAGEFWDNACSDYLAGRCCFLNSLLFQGLILFEQSIEKLMKAAILYSNPDFDLKKYKYTRHKLKHFFDPLKEECSIILNDDHQQFCHKLSLAFKKFRYPDYSENKSNKRGTSFKAATDDIDTMDDLFFELDDQIKSHDHLKYLTRMYTAVSEPCNPGHVNYPTYLYYTMRNKKLQERMESIMEKTKEAKKEIYGSE